MTTQSRYFKVLQDGDSRHAAAMWPKSQPLFLAPEPGSVTTWEAPLLTVHGVGRLADYADNNSGCRLCSSRMRRIVESLRGPADVVQWLPVRFEGVENDEYFILHFPSPPDVVHRERSRMAGGEVIKASFRAECLVGHTVFSYLGGGAPMLYVREDLKHKMESSALSGMEFRAVDVIDM